MVAPVNRQGYRVCLLAIVAYILLQTLFMNYDPGCNVHERFAIWTNDYFLCSAFAFFVSAAQHVSKAICCCDIDSKANHKRVMLYMTAVAVSLIACSSSILGYVYNFDNCQGVQWSQWIICMPFLSYIVMLGDDKKSSSYVDVGVIILLFVVVLCMLVIDSTVTNKEADLILYVISCMSVIGSMMLALIKVKQLQENKVKSLLSEKASSFFVLAINNSLVKLTWLILPFIPIISLIDYYHIITRQHSLFGYVLLSVFSNLIFLNYIVDEQIQVAEKRSFLKEAGVMANAARRSFLR